MNDAISRLVAESGNSFHCRVANAFRERNWATLLSPYYIDESTDKAREVDLVVEKRFPVDGTFGKPKTIRIRLYVECKYITQNVVFWFDQRDNGRAYGWVHRNTPFRKGNTLAEEHHHIKNVSTVAKLFATDTKRNEDNDPIFRALNQCLNGYVHNKGQELLIPAKNAEQVTLVEYPLIVVSSFSMFYRTDVQSSMPPEPITDNFLVELNYAFVDKTKTTRRDYFLVDVASFDTLDKYLAAIDHEVAHMRLLLED